MLQSYAREITLTRSQFHETCTDLVNYAWPIHSMLHLTAWAAPGMSHLSCSVSSSDFLASILLEDRLCLLAVFLPAWAVSLQPLPTASLTKLIYRCRHHCGPSCTDVDALSSINRQLRDANSILFGSAGFIAYDEDRLASSRVPPHVRVWVWNDGLCKHATPVQSTLLNAILY